MRDLSELQAEDFEALLGEELRIGEGPHALRLDSVTRLRSPSPRAVPFALLLSASPGLQGPQGMYRLHHPRLGELEIFLVPQPPVESRAQFEAVFN